MGGWLIFVLIYPHDKGLYISFGRCRDDYLFGATVYVGPGRIGVPKNPGTLGHIIDPQIPPLDIGRIFVTGDGDCLTIDDDTIIITADFGSGFAHDRVVFKQMGKSGVVGEVIYGHHFDITKGLILIDGPENISANTSETVDTNAYCHFFLLIIYFNSS